MTAIGVKGLVKDFGTRRVLSDISFQVETGSITGLIGPNGAGKTTILRILATLLEATSGLVEVAGFDRHKNPEKIRGCISYLPEEAGAYKTMTGIAYLTFIAMIYARVSGERSVKRLIERGVSVSQLGSRIDQRIDKYSKGMVRKLLISRALMAEPEIAILDEPTSGLDIEASIHVQSIIGQCAKDGTTVLLSSHNMKAIENLCDSAIIVRDGRTVEAGRLNELKQRHERTDLESIVLGVLSC